MKTRGFVAKNIFSIIFAIFGCMAFTLKLEMYPGGANGNLEGLFERFYNSFSSTPLLDLVLLLALFALFNKLFSISERFSVFTLFISLVLTAFYIFSTF